MALENAQRAVIAVGLFNDKVGMADDLTFTVQLLRSGVVLRKGRESR